MPAEAAAPTHGALPSQAAPVSRRLWEGAAPMAWRCLHHPFVRRLADATLHPAAFRWYLAQDATFLAAFAAAYATARAAAADGPGDAQAVAVLTGLGEAVQEELRLHEGYAAAWGVAPAALAAPPAPATAAYVRFLEGAGEGFEGSAKVAAILAAMAPCSRLYGWLGCALAEAGVVGAAGPAPHPYADWIVTYSSQAYLTAPAAKEALLDRLAGEVEEGESLRMGWGGVGWDGMARSKRAGVNCALTPAIVPSDAGSRSTACPAPPGQRQARVLARQPAASRVATRPHPRPGAQCG